MFPNEWLVLAGYALGGLLYTSWIGWSHSKNSIAPSEVKVLLVYLTWPVWLFYDIGSLRGRAERTLPRGRKG